jgi:hypothetical protein
VKAEPTAPTAPTDRTWSLEEKTFVKIWGRAGEACEQSMPGRGGSTGRG